MRSPRLIYTFSCERARGSCFSFSTLSEFYLKENLIKTPAAQMIDVSVHQIVHHTLRTFAEEACGVAAYSTRVPGAPYARPLWVELHKVPEVLGDGGVSHL